MRTFGNVEKKTIADRPSWVLFGVEPHIAIRLKAVSTGIPRAAIKEQS